VDKWLGQMPRALRLLLPDVRKLLVANGVRQVKGVQKHETKCLNGSDLLLALQFQKGKINAGNAEEPSKK